MRITQSPCASLTAELFAAIQNDNSFLISQESQGRIRGRHLVYSGGDEIAPRPPGGLKLIFVGVYISKAMEALSLSSPW